MIDNFQKYYQKNKLFKKTDKVLLTVSGGKDSMVMLNLFLKQNLTFSVAHCNFKLRGEEATQDQLFVKTFCEQNAISFYTIDFETQKYATEKGISIQMAARDLRYNWFEKIREENGYQYIATAHHKNDVAETMLINLTKGTGLAGLHGISYKKEKIIRPLLCFTRKEIDEFSEANKLVFREDRSNADTKYTRNLIRHQVIPELEKINTSIIETLNIEANRFLEDEKIISDKINLDKKRLFIADGNGFRIEIKELKKLSPLSSYLYYFLREYNFNSADITDIVNGLEGQSGKIFNSPTYQIIKDRETLLLTKIGNDIVNNSLEIFSFEQLPFDYTLVENISDLNIEKAKEYAFLDADKIQFPLSLRTWKNGDSFQPLGMKGKKKMSDFLIDNKISLLDKKQVQVLLQNNSIIWVVGHRIDDNYKVTSKTKRALIISI